MYSKHSGKGRSIPPTKLGEVVKSQDVSGVDTQENRTPRVAYVYMSRWKKRKV